MEHAVRSRRDGNTDRLSTLPDSLLHLIMSLLTTRQCATLSILSKRWKNLWTTLPFLDFNQNQFAPEPEQKSFREFVTLTLLLRDPTSHLHTFRLSCHHLSSMFYSSIKPWITYAMNCKPRVLNISLEIDNALPQCLFASQSLQDVSITIHWAFDPITSTPEFINLPNLRRLKLQGIEVDDNFLEMLFSGCPLLQDLNLDECKLEFSTLSSPTLKHLRIIYHYYASQDEEDILIERINTPSLISFKFSSSEDKLKDGVLVNMPSLEHAKLNITSPSTSVHMGKCNLLLGIPNVQNLRLSCYNIKELLENVLPTCPEFSNLRNLSMRLCLSCHFNHVSSFLGHSPNLKNLTLHDDEDECRMEELGLQGDNGRHKQIRISAFQCKQLSSVKILYSEYTDDFHEVTKSLMDGIKGYSNVVITIRALAHSLKFEWFLPLWSSFMARKPYVSLLEFALG